MVVKTYIRDGRAPIPKDENISKVMSSNKGKGTKPEIILRKALWANGIRGYRTNWKKLPGRPDIVFTKSRLAIFVNGCFWHRCPHCELPLPKTNSEFWESKFQANVERDKRKIVELEGLGWNVRTIWECEIKDGIEDILISTKDILKHRN